MKDPVPAIQSSPWRAVDFLLPFFLLLPAGDIAATHGSQVATLNIPGAGLVKLSPLFMLVAAIFTPPLLYRTRLARWRHGITTAMVFFCVLSPPGLLEAGSSSIPLSRWLSHEESDLLRQAFHVPCLFCSASSASAGQYVRVRRDADTAELRSYLQRLGVLDTGR